MINKVCIVVLILFSFIWVGSHYNRYDDKIIKIVISDDLKWKNLIDANGGLKTKDGSIFNKNGLNVELIISHNQNFSFLLYRNHADIICGSLEESIENINKEDKIIWINGSSNGNHIIVSKEKIEKIEDMLNKKIGIINNKDNYKILNWILDKSNLNDNNKEKIIKDLKVFNNLMILKNEFDKNNIDIIVSHNENEIFNNYYKIFSTEDSKFLLLNAIVSKNNFIEKNEEDIKNLISGMMEASLKYKNDYSIWNDTFKHNKQFFADKNINFFQQDNYHVFNNIIKNDNIMTNKFLLKNVIFLSQPQEDNFKLYEKILFSKQITIHFMVGKSEFINKDLANNELKNFIDIAHILNDSVIQIEGNSSPEGDNNFNIMLSKQRAEKIAELFIKNGIHKDRIIVIGNGSTKLLESEQNEKNRRTDIYFKIKK